MDHALWRRILVIPFQVTIPENERDRWLLEKLRHELPGIMAWALEGLREWGERGLAPLAAVRQATEEYRQEMDVLAPWLAECCVDDPQAATPVATLYAEYQAWCERAGEEPLAPKVFGRRLGGEGIPARQAARRRAGP